MRKSLICFLSMFLTACAASPPNATASEEQAAITGTRVEPSEVDDAPVMVLEPSNEGTDGLTVADLLRRMNDDSVGFPGKDDYSSCDDLISKINEIDSVSIVEISENAVVAKSERATMTYKFRNGGCLR